MRWNIWEKVRESGADITDALLINFNCLLNFITGYQSLFQHEPADLGSDTVRPTSSSDDKKAKIKAVNDHALLVQEYFQRRVESFLNGEGKKMFGIKHYWVRYEFAKGRGQIHAHLLAITDDAFQSCLHDGENEQERLVRVEKWAQTKFGLTAMHPATSPEGFLNMNLVGKPEGQQVTNTRSMSSHSLEKSCLTQDLCELCNCTQMHSCSNYCMRKPKKKKSNKKQETSGNMSSVEDNSTQGKKRYCRFGCGAEMTESKCDTPGFPLRNTSEIVRDPRGYNRLELKRNTKRMVQTSKSLVQAWRGNCDLQVLLYDSPADDFDFSEIARITDYVVSYACKGNTTLQVEKDNIKSVIMR